MLGLERKIQRVLRYRVLDMGCRMQGFEYGAQLPDCLWLRIQGFSLRFVLEVQGSDGFGLSFQDWGSGFVG